MSTYRVYRNCADIAVILDMPADKLHDGQLKDHPLISSGVGLTLSPFDALDAISHFAYQ